METRTKATGVKFATSFFGRQFWIGVEMVKQYGKLRLVRKSYCYQYGNDTIQPPQKNQTNYVWQHNDNMCKQIQHVCRNCVGLYLLLTTTHIQDSSQHRKELVELENIYKTCSNDIQNDVPNVSDMNDTIHINLSHIEKVIAMPVMLYCF